MGKWDRAAFLHTTNGVVQPMQRWRVEWGHCLDDWSFEFMTSRFNFQIWPGMLCQCVHLASVLTLAASFQGALWKGLLEQRGFYEWCQAAHRSWERTEKGIETVILLYWGVSESRRPWQWESIVNCPIYTCKAPAWSLIIFTHNLSSWQFILSVFILPVQEEDLSDLPLQPFSDHWQSSARAQLWEILPHFSPLPFLFFHLP